MKCRKMKCHKIPLLKNISDKKSLLWVFEVGDKQKIWIRNFNSTLEKAVDNKSLKSRFHRGSNKSEDNRALNY